MRPLIIFDNLMWSGAALSDSRSVSCPRTASGKAIFAGKHSVVLIVLVLLSVIPCAVAQKAVSSHAASARPAIRNSKSPISSSASARRLHASPKDHRSSPLSLLAPFLGDSFNPDDFSPNPEGSQPPPMLMQAVNALSGADYPSHPESAREPSSNQPLMIELQGGRYVRVDNPAIDGQAQPLNLAPGNTHPNNLSQKSTRAPQSITPAAPTPMLAASSQPHDLPPAVLVFQDGHTEEVREYTIADGFLYARGDFYTDGYWNKKIDVSGLNVPETLQANASRGVNFVLPSSTNEVITRF